MAYATPARIIAVSRRNRTVAGRIVHSSVFDAAGHRHPWNSRWHRKARSAGPSTAARRQRFLAQTTGWLLAAGSAFFIVAGARSLAGLPEARGLDTVGSILFSLGAVFAVLEAYGAARAIRAPGARVPKTAAGLASTIRLISAAVVFQASTLADALGAQGATVVWGIGVLVFLGGVGFVWSGWIYFAEARPARDLGYRVAVLKLVGSIVFLLSAMPGLLDPGEMLPATMVLVTAGYTAGSVAFLAAGVGAVIEVSRPLPRGAAHFPLHPATMAPERVAPAVS